MGGASAPPITEVNMPGSNEEAWLKLMEAVEPTEPVKSETHLKFGDGPIGAMICTCLIGRNHWRDNG